MSIGHGSVSELNSKIRCFVPSRGLTCSADSECGTPVDVSSTFVILQMAKTVGSEEVTITLCGRIIYCFCE